MVETARFFLELCLIFGGRSSVRISDIFAKIVPFIIIIQSGMPPSLVVQQIDVVACGPPDGELLEKFDKSMNLITICNTLNGLPDFSQSCAYSLEGRAL